MARDVRFRIRSVTAAWIFFLVCLCSMSAFAQNAQLSGLVKDPSNAAIAGASVEVVNLNTQVKSKTETDSAGFYVLPALPAGRYQVTVRAAGFSTALVRDITLNVAAKVALNFQLKIGQQRSTVTVRAGGAHLNTIDASVSTVVGGKFVNNVPLNGNSLQALMTLVPGATVVPSAGAGMSGEISVNGQRTESNYFTVDGVSADTGASVSSSGTPGAGFSGSTPAETALGTTQSLVPLDALEEFRATTSTYSAEYGRTAGGQFSLITKSGTNSFHGDAFDLLRNDALDANNWFNNYAGVAKQAERQNDFGGSLGGPVWIPGVYNGKDKSFFFFAYEGLRLHNPHASQLYEVPSNTLRQIAPPTLRPFLDAFPVSSQPDNGNGLSYYNAGYTSPNSIDSVSARIDHTFNDKLKVFGRFGYATSESRSRQPSDLAQLNANISDVKTVTLGTTSVLSNSMTNEFRFNFTDNSYNSSRTLDNFGGATPLNLATVPGLQHSSWITFFLFYDLFPYYLVEPQANDQHQLNFVDNFSKIYGRHNITFGVDYRRVLSSERLPANWEIGFYFDEAQVLANQTAGLTFYNQNVDMNAAYPNLSLFAQDEWQVTPKLSLSYGLRWELDPSPYDTQGNDPYTVNQITDLSTVRLAPRGTSLWNTTYTNFAPRLGIAYRIRPSTVLRAGGGLFYDTDVTSADGYYGVGFYGVSYFAGDPFPLNTAQVATVPTPNASVPYNAPVRAYDPHLKLPYVGQWNVAVEQGLGQQQTVTVNYVGSVGRRLLATNLYYPQDLGNTAFSNGAGLYLTTNKSSSNYNALQVSFQRSFSRGLQALASYTWAHSIDDSTSNFLIYSLERASSDYDIRHNFEGAVNYDIPGSYSNPLLSTLLRHWAVDLRVSARSALPVDIIGAQNVPSGTSAVVNFHPNRVPGQPLYVYNSSLPGGRAINYNAFQVAPAGTEGNAGRNSARGFNLVQTDMTLERDFPLKSDIALQFRVEAYNLFNQANFGSIYNQMSAGAGLFGQAYTTANNQLGGLNSLYQVGGPRSLEVGLRLHF